MKVHSLIKKKGFEVIAISGSSTVAEAINKMVERNIGAILVTGEGGTTGLFTERDVLKCWAKGSFKNLSDTPVKDVMTKDLIVVQVEDEVSYAMSVMIQKGIRHLPVLDKGALLSVLSIRDVVGAQVSSLEAEVHYLKEFICTAG